MKNNDTFFAVYPNSDGWFLAQKALKALKHVTIRMTNIKISYDDSGSN
jgi:hypothetical protein